MRSTQIDDHTVLARPQAAKPVHLGLEEELALVECRAQIVEPRGARMEPGEERTPDPLRVARLDEAEPEDSLAAGHRGPSITIFPADVLIDGPCAVRASPDTRAELVTR